MYTAGTYELILIIVLFHRGDVKSDEYIIIDEQNNCLVDIDMRFE